jgi:hypothetical protein
VVDDPQGHVKRAISLGRKTTEAGPGGSVDEEGFIGVGECCLPGLARLPGLAFEPVHSGAGTGRLSSAGRA